MTLRFQQLLILLNHTYIKSEFVQQTFPIHIRRQVGPLVLDGFAMKKLSYLTFI